MSEAITIRAICLTVCVCVASCSFGTIEQNRLNFEAKSACFQAGGEWDIWSSACRKSE